MPNSNILTVSPLAHLPINVVVNDFCVPCTDVQACHLGTVFAGRGEIWWDLIWSECPGQR